MDIQFYGANCIVLTSKEARLVVDDNLQDLGGKSVVKKGDIVLFTGSHAQPSAETKLTIASPGEYEVSHYSIVGIPARSHLDEPTQKTAVMYKVTANDLSFLFTGHIHPDITDSQLEHIGIIDVMFVPVGGNGYTLDSTGALALLKAIEPKLVIPTHYDDPSLHFPVPQQKLDEALKILALEPKETTQKLRIKPEGLPETTTLIVLDKS